MKRPHGFTLFEVLISLLIAAIGLLGMSRLLIEGLRASRSAAYRSSAVQLAGDFAERVRANPLADDAYSGPAADHACANGASNCTAAELAADDLWQWQADIARRLPAGATGTVALTDLDPGLQYVITLAWPEIGHSAPASYAVVVRL